MAAFKMCYTTCIKNNYICMKKIVIGLLFGLLVMSGCGVAQWFGNKKSVTETVTTTQPSVIESLVVVSTTPSVSGLHINWINPKELPPQHFFVDKYDENNPPYHNESSTKYYEVGVAVIEKNPAKIILAISNAIEMGPRDYYLFAVVDAAYVRPMLLANYSWSSMFAETAYPNTNLASEISGQGFIPRVLFTTSSVPQLDFPSSISGSTNPRQNVQFIGVAFNTIVTSSPVVATAYGTLHDFEGNNAFLLKNDLPITAVYSYKPDFYKEFVPQITWVDGVVNTTTEYTYATPGGCGSSNFIAVVPKNELVIQRDLIVAGTTNQGDIVYLLKDSNHKRLKNMYASSYFPNNGKKMSYEKFIEARPLVYWFDPFGRLIELQSSRFATQAECGKPVIYLYPPKTTSTTVYVQPQGGFTYTDPPYLVGWTVLAQPNGHLTDLRTNKEYPYLFWEGRGGFYEQPKQGWVVRQADLKKFLPTKLKQLGLNKNEANDFLEFWEPRMKAKPYYFVTFMGNKTMDILAPLTVQPTPDTVIRILMDFTPLDKPIKVKPFIIRTPKRTGFTVIEWGGVLR